MDASQRLAALQAEYFHLQKTVEDFDGKALTIKTWSVTFSMAVLVGAFTSRAAPVFLIAAASSLLFWILETLWKSFQLGYYSRIAVIEKYFRSPQDELPPFQVYATWTSRWSQISWTEVLGMAWWPHIALPHAAALVGGVALYFMARFGAFTL